MKRSIAVLAAATAAVSLAACGSSSKSKNTSPTTAQQPGATPTTPSSSGSANLNIGNPTKAITLNESGSSLLYPYLQELVSPLTAAYSNITLAPAAGGSGKGIADAASGTTQIGGSDAYLSPGQMQQYSGLLNVPIVVSGQAVNYNLPGITNLKLSGDILAQMYEGKITKWNDAAIAALNPGVNLPSTTVVPVRRVDSSGDTFIFTSFLAKTNSAWNSGPAFGTTVTWPAVSGELTASGNPGMVQSCKATPGCVAYVGVSSEAAAMQAGLGEVMLQNAAGNYLLPTAATETAAAAAAAPSVPANLAAPIIYQPGAQSYPIVNFEYIIVKSTQADADTAKAVRTFLAYAIDPNQGSSSQYLTKEDFVALPSSVITKVKAAIAGIS